ncbi:MAG: MlaA family lipoprotein [Proteobacteria bacterium]|nr:MlaA family lipoprotein [Pseudomonadota bacterium]
MTKRGSVAAALLIAGILCYGWAAAAASPKPTFRDYFEAAVRTADSGNQNIENRRRRIVAALSPLVTLAIVQQPGQIDAIMGALVAAAPDVAPAIAEQAMTEFPGFAGQIADAAGLERPHMAVMPSVVPARSTPFPRSEPTVRRANGHTARTSAWAISAIADNPGALDDIMSRAIAAAPGGEMDLVAATQAAYPGFAPQIAAAAAAPRTVSRPPLTSTPEMRPPERSRAAAQYSAKRQPIVRPTEAPAPVARAPVTYQAKAPNTAARKTPAAPVETAQPAVAEDDTIEIDDPLEPMNRIIFAFNDTLDLILLRPIAIGYNWILPDVAREAVRRAALNLDAPVIAVNDLLQGDLADAGVALGRFGINTTIGFLGLLDPAADFGLKRHHADFGQTLHSHDVGAGPYLVLPLLGPASTRGGVGKLVDIFFQPMTYLLSTGQNLGVAATRAVVRREELLDPLDELRENSIDYYTGLKAAFWQARQVELNKGTLVGLGNGGADKLFDAAN